MFKCSNIKINKYKFMVHLDCVVFVKFVKMIAYDKGNFYCEIVTWSNKVH